MSFSRREFIKAGSLSIAASGFVTKAFAEETGRMQSGLRNMVQNVKPLTMDDYKERLENAKKLLAENNLDALFLSGSMNLRYFTNVNWGRSERTFGAVINRKGDPIWICPGFELERAEERIKIGEHDIRTWEEHESPFKLIGGIMKDLGARNGRLGMGPTVRNFVVEGLKRDASSLTIVDGSVITEGCRGIKNEKEIGYMDLAARITKIAYREAFKNLYEGMTPRDISVAVSKAHQQMGVSGGAGVQMGLNSAFPHGSRERRTLHDGSIILIDGGCGVEGFRSDVSRTIVFGKHTDKQKKVWDIVRKAQLAAYEAAKAGAPCEAVDIAARKVVDDAGFGPEYKYFAHRVGHGIGMEGHEYPYLVRGNKLKMAPGMTFSNEPGIYIYGEFGVRIEDCMVITPEGGKCLGGLDSTAIDKPFG